MSFANDTPPPVLTQPDGIKMTKDRPNANRKVTEVHIRAALKQTGGLIARAAKTLGISRQSLHERISNSPALKQFITDLNEGMLDAAENVIHDKITSGCDVNSRWFLDRKGRHRGYGQKVAREEVPPDPATEARRHAAVMLLTKLVGDGYAAGTQPLLPSSVDDSQTITQFSESTRQRPSEVKRRRKPTRRQSTEWKLL